MKIMINFRKMAKEIGFTDENREKLEKMAIETVDLLMKNIMFMNFPLSY